MILTADAAFDAQFKTMKSLVAYQFHTVVCAPIPVLSKSHGVLYSYSHKSEAFTSKDLELVSMLGIQLDPTIVLLKVVKKNDKFFRDSLQALVAASEMRTSKIRGHYQRLATYALAMGKELVFDTHRLRNPWIAGRLHNIGVIPMSDKKLQQEHTAETKKNHYARQLVS